MEIAEGAMDEAGDCRDQVADAMRRVAESVGRMCAGHSCMQSIQINTRDDVLEAYFHALACVEEHVPCTVPVQGGDLFVVEEFVLDQICEPKMLDFNKIFENAAQCCRKEQVLRITERLFPDCAINIDCEQEVESLMYRLYAGCPCKEFGSRDIELLLAMLFRRNETARFFRVFNQHVKTEAMFRMGLLMALKEEDASLVERLVRDMNGYKFSLESSLQDVGDNAVARLVGHAPAGGVREWLDAKSGEIEWEECVRFWCMNRNGSPGAINKSMMDLCIKYKRYEEGWIVYTRGCGKTNYVIHKACILALKALRETNGCKWISRLLEVVEDSFVAGDGEARYLIANDILESLPMLSEDTGSLVLKEFMGRVEVSDKNEEVISVVISGLFALCRNCESSQTCTMCADHADKLYSKWRTHRLYSGYVFEEQDKVDSEIYSNMLGVFDVLKDKGRLLGVCRDLANSNIKMTKELHSRLQKLHMADRISSESDSASMEQRSTWERLMSLILQKH